MFFFSVVLFSVLDTIDSIPCCLPSFLSVNSIDTEIDLNIENRRVHEHFSKLKLGFLHLESKQRFLAAIVTENDQTENQQDDKIHNTFQHLIPEQSQITKLQQQVQQGRKHIQRTHTENIQKIQQIQEKIDILIQSKQENR